MSLSTIEAGTERYRDVINRVQESAGLEEEQINRPTWDKLNPQGKDRFLVRVHQNKPYESKGGIIIPDSQITQDIPTTGTVLKCSPSFDRELYPGIVPGANVKVVINTWATFDCHGEKLAFAAAEYVIATY